VRYLPRKLLYKINEGNDFGKEYLADLRLGRTVGNVLVIEDQGDVLRIFF